MVWIVETLGETVDEELDALPSDLRARFVRICELIRVVGIERLGLPHVRYLQNSLWEIRLKGKSGIARAVYVKGAGQKIVVLRVFRKKSDKTPLREIRLATGRARKIEE